MNRPFVATHALELSLSRREMLERMGIATAGAALAATIPGATRAMAQETPERREGGTIIYDVRQEGSHLVPPFSSFSTVIEPTVAFFKRPGPAGAGARSGTRPRGIVGCE